MNEEVVEQAAQVAMPHHPVPVPMTPEACEAFRAWWQHPEATK